MKYFIAILILNGAYASMKFLITCAKGHDTNTNKQLAETNNFDTLDMDNSNETCGLNNETIAGISRKIENEIFYHHMDIDRSLYLHEAHDRNIQTKATGVH